MHLQNHTIEISCGGFDLLVSSDIMLDDTRWNNLEASLRLLGIERVMIVIDVDTEYDIAVGDINEGLEAAFYGNYETLQALQALSD